MPTDRGRAMQAFLGLLCFAGLLGAYALLRWLRTVRVHDATVLVPRSMPCLTSVPRRPSDDWQDEAVDRMADELARDEHEEGFIG